jgi:hypothetical protein
MAAVERRREMIPELRLKKSARRGACSGAQARLGHLYVMCPVAFVYLQDKSRALRRRFRLGVSRHGYLSRRAAHLGVKNSFKYVTELRLACTL